MTGTVIRNTGSFYTVATDDGCEVQAKIKGNFRLKGIRTTNPVAVGDRVELDGDTPTSTEWAARCTTTANITR